MNKLINNIKQTAILFVAYYSQPLQLQKQKQEQQRQSSKHISTATIAKNAKPVG